jgi:4-alpha-glucanotransferase
MNKLYLGLVLHSHQPVGNFENIFEIAYQKAYSPFIETFEKYPSLKVTLHYSGVLVDWLQEKHPEFLERLRDLCHWQRVEMMTGGHYEPILSILPEADRQAQIEKLTGRLIDLFGQEPKGLWVAERVWEQTLVEVLHDTGVDYVILDDTHFLYAGLRREELTGYYITEEKGKVLKLVPGSKKLRYTIPFAEPAVTIDYLKEVARSRAGALVVMGDDCEKFGVWPKTYEHVYGNAWLDRFFLELERNQDWLEVICLSDYLQAHKPLGRIYVPNASYPEMMEWVLPVKSRELQHHCVERLGNDPKAEELIPFIRGGFWRNFLVRYGESNFLHKKMLATSRRLQKLSRVIAPAVSENHTRLQAAHDHLLRAQCNDAYWHGVFGGLYAPHLRTALLSNLIEANRLADELEYPGSALTGNDFHLAQTVDFDSNGSKELLIQTRNADVLIDPEDGATVREIDFKPCATGIVNSLKRQQEYYHRYLMQTGASGRDSLPAKEKNLEEVLRYDRYARSGFRIFLFPKTKSIEDYDRQNLAESVTFAQGSSDFSINRSRSERTYQFRALGCLQFGGEEQALEMIKSFKVESEEKNFSRISFEIELRSAQTHSSGWVMGIENVINFLAPDAHDRYITAPSYAEEEKGLLGFEPGDQTGARVHNAFRRALNWFGVVSHRRVLVFTDEWRQVEVKLGFEKPVDWWVVPIYTVSQFEDGYEKVYQGSQILAVLPPLNWVQDTTWVRHWMEVKKLAPLESEK